MLSFLPRAMPAASLPIDPSSLVCEVLRRSGGAWVLDVHGNDLSHRRAEVHAAVTSAQQKVLTAARNGSLPIYVHVLGDPICYRVPLEYFEQRRWDWDDAEGGDWEEGWLGGQLCSLFQSNIPSQLIDKPVFAFDDEADAWLNAAIPAAEPAHSKMASPQEKARTKEGGRNSDKHGEPIAKLTILLMSMDRSELARVTGDALSSDLADAYRAAGAAPPSAQNLIGICWGILRAVREQRA